MSASIVKKLQCVTSSLDEIKAKALEHPLTKNQLNNGFSFEALHPYFNTDGKLIYLKIHLKNPNTGKKWIRPIPAINASLQRTVHQQVDFDINQRWGAYGTYNSHGEIIDKGCNNTAKLTNAAVLV